MTPVLRTRGRAGGGKRKGPNPLTIAALTILLAVVVTYYAFSGKQIPFVHSFTMHALVRNSVDIIPDSPVRIAGIDVGKVSGTSAHGALTRVDFTVDSNGQPVHTDATVTIRDRLFLEGGYYLQLDPGSPSAPVAKDGFTVPISITAFPVQFYQVLSTFDSATRRSLQNTLNTLNEGFSAPAGQQASPANSGVGGFKQAIPQFAPTLKDVAWSAEGLHGTKKGDVERLLTSGSDVTATLARSSSQLADLVTGLDRTSAALASSDGALAQSVAGVDQTLRAAPPALTAVDHALPPLTHLASALDPSLKVAPPLVDGLTKAVGELAAVVEPAERGRLLDTLKTTFVQFPSTLRQLGTAFPVTKAVTDCLRTHVTPVLTSQVPDGSLSSGEPVWQDFVHFVVGLSSAVQNFDGNGYWIRSILGTGTNSASVGQLLNSSTTSIPGIEGSSPHWVGDLTPSDFRPDAPCASQPLVNLSNTSGSSAFSRTSSPNPQATAATNGVARFLGLR
jgi:ABC-type transporter Mla subunit MlaD